ncbi:MAG: hypothetical protein ACOVP7_04325 [Lacibacter sp.]
MLPEILEAGYYKETFFKSFNPYISHPFVALNAGKVEQIICLANAAKKPDLGLLLGVRNNQLLSPFSAPFGGFHYRHEAIYAAETDLFLLAVKQFFEESTFEKLTITLPPDIYSSNMNAKFVSAFIRCGYVLEAADVTNYIPLREVGEKYSERTARDYYAQAVKHELRFEQVKTDEEIDVCYAIVKDNRSRMGRPIFMTANDLKQMQQLWPVDFFLVKDTAGVAVAAAIFYRGHGQIAQAVLWGDSETGRPLRAMDYMIFELCRFYKQMNYSFIDLGISTEKSVPNSGLLRFKETHESHTGIRYTFSLGK